MLRPGYNDLRALERPCICAGVPLLNQKIGSIVATISGARDMAIVNISFTSPTGITPSHFASAVVQQHRGEALLVANQKVKYCQST